MLKFINFKHGRMKKLQLYYSSRLHPKCHCPSKSNPRISIFARINSEHEILMAQPYSTYSPRSHFRIFIECAYLKRSQYRPTWATHYAHLLFIVVKALYANPNFPAIFFLLRRAHMVSLGNFPTPCGVYYSRRNPWQAP
jgi:hypothetical protein